MNPVMVFLDDECPLALAYSIKRKLDGYVLTKSGERSFVTSFDAGAVVYTDHFRELTVRVNIDDVHFGTTASRVYHEWDENNKCYSQNTVTAVYAFDSLAECGHFVGERIILRGVIE